MTSELKTNKLYYYSAIVGTMMKFYNMKELAETVADELDEIVDTKIEVYNTKSDGFILRKKVDTGVSTADVIKGVCKAIKKLVKDTDGDIADYLADQYASLEREQEFMQAEIDRSEDTETGTNSYIRLLNNDERIKEIANMLSGSTLTEAALNNARALLEGNSNL